MLGAALLLPAMVCAQKPEDGAQEAQTVTPTVEVVAPRLRMITPLPGVVIDRETASTSVQSVEEKQIEASRSASVTEVLNTRAQSVTVNDYTGNPFRQDVNYRGFSASPLIGTPQGLSVYLDGVRVNEAFGEVVNWDLIPLNAVQRMDIIPGSNPLFGLNTLGGALAISTKSGFSAPRATATVLGGSWNRQQLQVSGGGSQGNLAGFLAYTRVREDGWRDNSPSALDQVFARGDVRGRFGQFTLSGILADTDLVGNGVVPEEMYRARPQTVFTSPDENSNRLAHLSAIGRLDLRDTTSLSLMGYYRQLKQRTSSGDIYDEWDQAANGRTGPCPSPDPSTYPDGAAEVDAPGCAGITPNGVFNRGTSDQQGYGLTAQLQWVTERNQLVVGTAYDRGEVDFRQTQQLAWVGSDRNVYLDPTSSPGNDLVALRQEILRNQLNGSSTTLSAFFNDIWSVRPNLHLNFGARYNHTRVINELISDRPIPLYQFTTVQFNRLRQRCGAETDPRARFYCSQGDYTYTALNPAAGVSWLPNPRVNLFANYSRGSRAPSALELGCARDRTAEEAFRRTNNGKLQGCSIPTALTSDPFLPQVRSTSYELGLRGELYRDVLWNAAAFRTDLEDDILFVSVGKRNRGVFDTFGSTRRQGFELGIERPQGRLRWYGSYSRVDATFEDEARIANLSNSTSSKVPGQPNEFVVQPGDRIPGIPRDSLRFGLDYDFTPRLALGFAVIAQSWSYVRGNENNDHAPGGTDSDGSAVTARYDPSITTSPGRAYVGQGKVTGYAILNLNASYRLSDQWSMFLRIDNVFDRQYATAGELGLNPFTPSRFGMRDASGFNYNSFDWTHSLFVGPGAPRAFWLGVTYSWSGRGGS
jgi:outer membrane receptor protein involved in Fe transport